jgi:DNA-binding MarR family transcriptional regulator
MKNFTFSPIKKLLFAVIKLAKKDMERQFSRAGIGISQLQYWVLVKLCSGPITINEIARQFDIKPPSLIPVVDALEKADYLLRKHDKTDRRKIQLLITKKGEELVKKIPSDNKTDALNKAFNKLSGTKQKQLLESLQELTDNFPK